MTLSDEIVLTLVPDATPPRVIANRPPEGSLLPAIATISATFNEPILRSTLTSEAFRLVSGGNTVAGATLRYLEETDTVLLGFESPLTPSTYTLSIDATISDLRGNTLEEAFSATFILFDNQGIDSDNDGIPDDIEPLLGLNPNDPDSDGNGTLDGEEDFDNDGLSNAAEIALGQTSPSVADSDGNGIVDGDEDFDFDGLTNAQEVALGTNPLLLDSDGDRFSDEAEITAGTDPLDPLQAPIGSAIARPTATVFVPNLEGESLGLVISSPPVRVLTATADEHNLGLILTRPPTIVTLPGAGGGSTSSLGVTMARPPSSILLPAADSSSNSTTTIARPPATVTVPN